MPKIDVTQNLKDLDGKNIAGPPGKNGKPDPTTLRSVSVLALLAAREGQTGAQRYENYQLSQKISTEDCPMLTSEEITLLKQIIGDSFIAIIVGRAWDALDQKTDSIIVESA